MNDDLQSTGEFLLYTTEDGKSLVECRFQDETIWLSQKLISQLFEVEVPTINEHLKTLYETGEIDPAPTIRKFRIVRQEGSNAASQIIKAAMEQNLVKLDPNAPNSRKYARYLPIWA